MTPIDAVLVGAGQRGRDAFGAYALRHPDQLRFVAVADPDEGRRRRFAADHRIPAHLQFDSWAALADQQPLAPIAFNATLDTEHVRSSLPLMRAGYHLLLEKPMATSPQECTALLDAAREYGVMVQICHPLRFTPFYLKIKELISSGAIGRILTISMSENVGYWHFAHSFVRGNWGRVDKSGPLILTKCCHDMDLATWLADSSVRKVSSLGKLAFFRKDNAPAGAAARCLEPCAASAECAFYAPGLYLGEETEWPVSVISLDSSLEARQRALETGPYGRCVFQCDNTTVDQQTVIADFENGVMLDFSVRAASFHPCRNIRIAGTKGELNGHFEKNEIQLLMFGQGTGAESKPLLYNTQPLSGAHGGGDEGAIANFLRCYREGDHAFIRKSLELAVEGHLLAFAAEEARASEQSIAFDAFRSQHDAVTH